MTHAMKTLHTVMTFAALFTLGACSSEPTESLPSTTAASTEQITVLDCQKQVTTCTRAAKSFADFAKCTTGLASCTAQAALDITGQGNLLANCRAKADTCLKGAVSVSDISSCRDIYAVCTADIADATDGALSDALKVAQDAVNKAAQLATDTINAATGDVSKALDAVGACETKANSCLKAVVKLSDISPCEETFDTCTSKAISVLDTVTSSLPLPTPSKVLDGLQQCQDQSTACLKGAVTVSDVSACKTVLQTCVKNAASIVDNTVSGVTSILPLPVKLPGIGQTVDCTSNLAECLLKLGNPADCAAQAAACETK
jgi:hypothetical protein